MPATLAPERAALVLSTLEACLLLCNPGLGFGHRPPERTDDGPRAGDAAALAAALMTHASALREGADAGALARRVMRCLAASEHGRAGLRNALVARHAASVAEAGAAGEHARTRLGLAAKWAADRAEGLLLDRGVLQEMCETYDQDREWPMQPAHAKYAALEAALQVRICGGWNAWLGKCL